MFKERVFPLCVLNTLCLLFGGRFQDQQTEPPRVTAVEPSNAATTPGANVTVVGANFSPDVVVYFGGFQAREMTFINTSALQVVTPYVRPGTYKVDLKSGQAIIHSEVSFTADAAPVDSTLDQAEELASQKQTNAAIATFTRVAESDPDYDVRAYAHYRAGQLYLLLGNYMEAGEQAGLIWDKKASMGVQSSWRYRVFTQQMEYTISESDRHDDDLRTADWDVKWDVTDNPEPRFDRALLNARFGNMERAKADLKLILASAPNNVSYKALAAYIGVLAGDKEKLETFRDRQVNDERALALLGQAAYLANDHSGAEAWWTAEAKISKVQATLDCGAGRKHVHYGQTRVGAALLAECVAVTPESGVGKEARGLLAGLANSLH